MMMTTIWSNFSCRHFIKFSAALLYVFFAFVPEVSADSWVLSAQEFVFEQPDSHSASDMKAAGVIPQLILEQIAQDRTRNVHKDEKLDRALDSLQTERLSLFLQLSKEYKTRDALVLSKKTAREFEKAVREENEKIAEIEEKIDANLREADRKTAEIYASADNDSGETVVIYKNDVTALFKPSKDAVFDGIKSWTYSREIASAKINGLITGKIVSYGEYASVTAELFVFPGARSSGAVTEIGLLSDSLSIARRLVRGLSPKIANSLPVKLMFDIGPGAARDNCRVNIDGVVYTNLSESVVLDAGIHTLTVESPGYDDAIVTYDFSGTDRYVITTDLRPSVKGSVNLRLKKLSSGVFYARALEQSSVDENNPEAVLTINGKSVLGIWSKLPPKEDAIEGNELNAFFYIPSDELADGAKLVVNAKPFNRENNIDKRRRGMYTAYTALICSLPFTFYCVGNFTAVNQAYANSDGTTISYDDVKKWQTRSYATLGVTGACGVWLVVELIRYLNAANDVLPATAYSY